MVIQTATRSRRSAQYLFGLSALALSIACGGGGGNGGGGGGGGGGGTGPTPLVFTPSGAGGAGTITLAQGAGTTNTTLVVDVRANDLGTFYGTAFDLSFPANLLQLTQSAEGSYANAGGATTSFRAVQSQPGLLVVGLTRIGAVDATGGSGTLLTLTFTTQGSGAGNFSFSNNLVYGADGRPVLAVAWGAASVQVTP